MHLKLKRTESVTAIDPPCRNGNARFTMVCNHDFCFLCGFYAKVTFAFLSYTNHWRNAQKLALLESENGGFFHIFIRL